MKALEFDSIQRRYNAIKDILDERGRRLWAGAEALELGYGGIAAVARATGLTPKTVGGGAREVANPQSNVLAEGRQRKEGGGRKRLTQKDPALLGALKRLVEPYTRGDPMRPLLWTCKSTAQLSKALKGQGHQASAGSVATLLKEAGYSLQSNRKTHEHGTHADRNAQFEYIARSCEEFHQRACPVISVDAKKKELVGNFKNAGREWLPTGHPHEVEVYDFVDPAKGKATPYGIYDVGQNLGWVSVGSDHDTAEFAVKSISRWWEQVGEWTYPDASEILIVADGGGSNGSRNRLWKKCLQDWADREGLKVMVCHLPPGTSKWNKIEHRMFCHITRNWRGKPLISYEVIVSLIGATTTGKGLRIQAEFDPGQYELGKKVSDEQFASLSILRADFHGEWNYCILPRVG